MKVTTETFASRLVRVATLAGALLVCATVLPALAHGSQYWVEECSDDHPSTPDAISSGSSNLYVATNDCAGVGLLEIRPSQTGGHAEPRDARQWRYQAPVGTTFPRVIVEFGLVSEPNDHVVSLFVQKAGASGQERLAAFHGGGSSSGTYDSDIQPPGPLTRIGVRMSCRPAGSGCDYAPGTQVRMGAVRFLMVDNVAPEPPVLSGAAASGEWLSGTAQVTVAERDQGAGVARTLIDSGGVALPSSGGCATAPGADGNVGTMSPCPAVASHDESIDTTATAFEDGPGNELRVCSEEYGSDPASGCRTIELAIDNVAPTEPRSLALAGGPGWRRDNDFDLSWSNPPQDHAPIAGAVVRVTGPGGYEHEYEYEGNGIDEAKNLHVPEPGEYEAGVYLVDEAGNVDPERAATVPLRFDNTVPPESKLNRANGWLSRDELAQGYLQQWIAPAEEEVPPSGIAGYRFAVDMSPDTDPCDGAADPRACGGPITHHGIASNSQMLGADDLNEGVNYAHAVSISGSGMRSAQVDHSEVKVDTTDATTLLRGWSGGWAAGPVDLRAEATDALSGMATSGAHRDDAPPRTVLEVDGVLHEDEDGSVEATVSGEGAHHVRYWARDLAGNENDGAGDHRAPGEALVRIDSTSPSAAFADRQDPEDPDRLLVRAGDGLSGIAAARISYRATGEDWTGLPTELGGDGATARVDSARMEPGTTYEFRAFVSDRAGNETETTARENGSPMRVVGPLRAATQLSGLRVNGRRDARVKQGKRALLTGKLRDDEGSPVPGATVRLSEAFAPGARLKARERVARTGANGRFEVALRRGPSRTVSARFAGDRKRLGSPSRSVRVRVRSRVTLRAPRRVRAGGRVTFRGRVRAPGVRLRGKRVEVQVRVGRRWKAVGRSLRTRRNGSFRLRYRFVAAYRHPVRYRFRAVALRERGFPYLPSHSRQRRLTVRP